MFDCVCVSWTQSIVAGAQLHRVSKKTVPVLFFE